MDLAPDLAAVSLFAPLPGLLLYTLQAPGGTQRALAGGACTHFLVGISRGRKIITVKKGEQNLEVFLAHWVVTRLSGSRLEGEGLTAVTLVLLPN